MKKIYVLFILLIITVFSLTGIFVEADIGGVPPSGGTPIPNPLGGGINTLSGFVEAVLKNIVVPIGSIVVVLMIIYSGFLFVTAQGNPVKLEKAKVAFLWTAIGTIVLLGATAIATAIENTINQITG